MANELDKHRLDQLTDIFRTLFNNPSLELRDDLTANQVPGWDSFNHINLVMQVEEDMGVRFTTQEIAALANVGEFKALIARKLAARKA
jgi:acyl carrier protein